MKTKVFVFICLVLMCCNMKTTQKTDTRDCKKNQLENSILGEWQICKSTSLDEEISYNVCPTIIFSKDGKGNIKFLEKKHCDFQFSFKNDIIIFSFKSANDKNAFFASGKKFNLKLKIENKKETIELSQLNTDYKFILSRIPAPMARILK